MKTIRVAAAILCDNWEQPGRIFATQRGYGEQKGGWEFPGGKLEPGESSRDAIIREIREELDITIVPGPMIHTVEYDYPAFHLSMDCFLCRIAEGEITLREAQAARWLTVGQLEDVSWLPADEGLIPILAERMRGTAC